jgi:hypothetical protein
MTSQSSMPNHTLPKMGRLIKIAQSRQRSAF